MTHAAKRRDERPASSMLPGDRVPTPEEMRAAARQGITVVELRRRLGPTHASDEDADRRARFARATPPGRAHEHYPPAPGEPPVYLSETVDEKHEQIEVVKVFAALGFKARNLSQARASKQSEGPGDLWLTNRARGMALWWETKRQVGGRHSPAQIEFAEDCEATGTLYGTGDRYDARRFLVQLGLAEWRNAVLHPTQRAL